MRTLVAALLAVLLLAAVPAAATTAARSCRQVSFTANSDDLAGSIKVRNVSCRYARRFIRRSEGRPPETLRGWRCRARRVEDALVHTDYRCTRDDQVMRWSRF